MNPSDALIRTDLDQIPAISRRLARLSLQFFLNDTSLVKRLNDWDFLSTLWQLSQCLLEPAARAFFDPALAPERLPEVSTKVRDGLRALTAELRKADAEPDQDVVEEEMRLKHSRLSHQQGRRIELPPPPSKHRKLRLFFTGLSPAVLEPLVEADGETCVVPLAEMLGRALELEPAAARLLEYLVLREQHNELRILLKESRRGHLHARHDLHVAMTILLGIAPPVLRRLMAKSGPLRKLGLMDMHFGRHLDLEDYLDATDLLRELIDAEPEDEQALLALLIEPAPAADWSLDAFPHLHEEALRAQGALNRAARDGVAGVNALFYGPPGTGKTELARAIAASCDLKAFQVRTSDEDDDGLDREGRLSAYLLAQRLLARRRDAVIIFDEVEDVFEQQHDLFALLSGRSPAGEQKGWMNRMLEENPVPTIWISNEVRGLDPAFQRRFLLPVCFITPPRSVRRQMAERHLGDLALSPALLDELAADEALTPAGLGAARRLVDLQPDAPVEITVRAGVASLRKLLHGTPAPRRRENATAFDVAYLNLAGGIAPNALFRALEREGSGRLCFYGPPGTGKTAFAEVLADALDRELVARQASDLISPYVGETEQNLARLFASVDPKRSVLLIDEVDSFLADRRQAQRQWERTQVNELLQQMERYPGILIAATNLMSGLDGAALRRFDFKLEFRALKPEQRLSLFAREALGDTEAPVPENVERYLEGLDHLTAGDFANVARQRKLLGERLEPETYLRRLVTECRLKSIGKGGGAVDPYA
ncbi:AAA family ATPase [Thiorhodovibrio frisius]|uniref:AAA family ATPase n=1 Tax=Thiorhodovibrio frisius TaxID=631362 RepID=UPI002B25F8A5|nr:AAA family ATPase [Thiorhodovibrio frisius]WPL22959.1 Proteasomal ATPase [Thiorhodovibrio frisius]